MRDEMKEGVAAQRADGQRHQEAEEELEENSVHERDEDDAEQGEQADDRDGDEPADPGCNARNQTPQTKLQTASAEEHRPDSAVALPIVMLLPLSERSPWSWWELLWSPW